MKLISEGCVSLQAVARDSGLDRYTIYKINEALGRSATCKCGRPIAHRGNCKPRFSAAVKRSLDKARDVRDCNSKEWKEFRAALSAIDNVKKKLKEYPK